MTKNEILAGLEQLYNKKMTKKQGLLGGVKFDASELKAVEAAYEILYSVPDKYFDAYNDPEKRNKR